jgi:hypothetical protein
LRGEVGTSSGHVSCPSDDAYAQRPALGVGLDDVVDAGNRHHGAAVWLKLGDLPEARTLSRGATRCVGAGACRWRRVALAWVLHNTVVASPIVDPTKPHHLADAVAAWIWSSAWRKRRPRAF